MNKRGYTHIEVIIAFVLFFAFVTFLMIYIRPYSTTTLSESVVSAFYDSFKQQSYTNLTTFFLKADYNGQPTCFYIELNKTLFEFSFSDAKSLVKPVNGSVAPSALGPERLYINKTEEFYNVLISPDFENSLSGTSSCENFTDYKLGSINEKQLVSNKSLFDLKDRYEKGYSALRQDLNLPGTFDFAIVSDLVVMQKNIPEKAQVVARSYIEEVLLQDGTVVSEKFTLMVW